MLTSKSDKSQDNHLKASRVSQTAPIPWSKEEDMVVMAHVAKYGANRWAQIAKRISNRNGKQCRKRWINQLDPRINTSSRTDAEDRTLIQAHLNVLPTCRLIPI